MNSVFHVEPLIGGTEMGDSLPSDVHFMARRLQLGTIQQDILVTSFFSFPYFLKVSSKIYQP
jgi:hypothetical protein